MAEMTSSYITAMLLGFFSTAHCIAMCGSVIGALTLSLPAETRENHLKMLPFVVSYNVGRIISYALAGAVVGLLSSPLAMWNAHDVLRILSVIVMIGMGLYLAGWFPRFAQAERLGAPIWRLLQPIGQRLLPVRNFPQAFFLGCVWGWLPCGLVYAALAVAATTGDVLTGSLTMLAFGAGTLPAVVGAGMFAGTLAALGRSARFRQLAGLLIIAMALALVFWPMDGHQHHHDGENDQHEHSMMQNLEPTADEIEHSGHMKHMEHMP